MRTGAGATRMCHHEHGPVPPRTACKPTDSLPMTTATLQTFPSEFPIKVMGRRDGDLVALTRAIVERHTGALEEARIRMRTSTDGNFLAVTYVIEAQSQMQLDDIYRALTACKAVLMAL